MLLFRDKLLNIKENRKGTLCLEIRCGKALDFRNSPCVGSLGECFFFPKDKKTHSETSVEAWE